MIDIPPDQQGIEIQIEMEGGDETSAAELRKIFDGEDEDGSSAMRSAARTSSSS